MKQSQTIRELCLSYALELETVRNQIAASVSLDGGRSEVLTECQQD